MHSTLFGLAFAAAAIGASSGALAQSAHDAVASDGSRVKQRDAANYGLGMAALEGRVGMEAPAFIGAKRVTEEALHRDGVEIYGALPRSALELMRAAALPDGGRVKGSGSMEVIIGADRRERVYTTEFPSRARVLITFDGGRCSGTLINANTVVTAGHCLHSGGAGGAWKSTASYRIYAGANGTINPYGSCTAKSLHSVAGWTSSGNESYDYGAIKLNCTIGNTVGWYGYSASAAALNNPAIIGGYPGDKPLTQWVHADKVRDITAEQIFYANDTTPGSSGSGVWWDNGGAVLIGIHAYGTHGASPHSVHNHGKRITAAVVSNFDFWKALP